MEQKLIERIQKIKPVSSELYQKCQDRWDRVAKPLGGLGKLEALLCQIGAIQNRQDMQMKRKAVVVFCADNGVVAEGVTQCGSEVTANLVRVLAGGGASVNVMASVAGAQVMAIDVGVACDLEIDGLYQAKIAYGTKNMVKAPAMTREQAVKSVQIGMETADFLIQQGYHLLAAGEAGIGNTTSGTAVLCALLDQPPKKLTGRGAGLSDDGLQRKIAAIERALAIHQPQAEDPLDVLYKVGGFDLGAMAGLFLGGALARTPVVMDGVISAAAALLAVRLCPAAVQYILPSHQSSELGMTAALTALQMEPVLQAQMHLGEGTGAVALFPLLDMAYAVYNNTTFEEMKIEEYQHYTPSN